ncbi:MAG: hypothetical protein V4481_05120 [Patescibacteria group bacterium]
MSADLTQILKSLQTNGTKGPNGVLVPAGSDKVDSLKKEDKPKGKRGGVRPNSGRKTLDKTIITKGIKAWMNDHANESVPLTLMDRKTGKTVTIKKPRRVIAIEKLFEIGVKGDSVAGNVSAIKEWLDRYAGKAAQPIRGEGEDDPPIKLHVDNLEELVNKVYGGGN